MFVSSGMVGFMYVFVCTRIRVYRYYDRMDVGAKHSLSILRKNGTKDDEVDTYIYLRYQRNTNMF